MPGLSAKAVLAIWEQTPVDDVVRGPLTILAHAHPELSEDTLLNMSVGRRDRLLLQQRRQLFGEHLAGFAHCPQCAERLEFSVALRDIRSSDDQDETDAPLDLSTNDFSVRARPPNSHDLFAAQHCSDPDHAARLMFERCVDVRDADGHSVPADELPDDLLSAISDQLSEHQGTADVELAIECDACGHRWNAQLDIASYFQRELSQHAGLLLDQVHTLAAAYGWNEKAIVAMHPRRRQAYLQRLLT